MYKLSLCHSFPVEDGICTRCGKPCETFEVTAEKYGYHGQGGFWVKHPMPFEEAAKEVANAEIKYLVADLAVDYLNGISVIYYTDGDPKEKVVRMDAKEFYLFTCGKYWYKRNTRNLVAGDEIYYADNQQAQNAELYKGFLATITPESINSILPAMIAETFKKQLI